MTTYRRVSLDQITMTVIGMVVVSPFVEAALDWTIQSRLFRDHGTTMIGPALYLLLVRGLWTRVELADGALRVRRDWLWSTRWDVRDVERARLWSVRGPDRGERWRLTGMGAVELTLRGGRTVRVGSLEPGRLLEAIRAAAPEVMVDPEVVTGPESGPLQEPEYRSVLALVEAAVVGSLLEGLARVAWQAWP